METIQDLIAQAFPEASACERVALESRVIEIITSSQREDTLDEAKSLGKFAGEISGIKQNAIVTASSLPRPVTTRRGLERDARKRLDKRIANVETELHGLLKRYHLPDGDQRKLTISQFEKRAKEALRPLYQEAYQLGTRASGLVAASDLGSHLGADEKKWLQNAYTSEMKYFANLLRAMKSGESIGRTKKRLTDYANAVNSVFDSSRILQLPRLSIIHWVLESDNPCPECRLLHKLSPFVRTTLPTTPKAGDTRCLSNCYCKLRIVSGSDAKVQTVLRRNKSAEKILKELVASRKKR